MASSSAGWTKVYAGLRLVASATASNASSQTAVVSGAVARHGIELNNNLYSAFAAAQQTQQPPPQQHPPAPHHPQQQQQPVWSSSSLKENSVSQNEDVKEIKTSLLNNSDTVSKASSLKENSVSQNETVNEINTFLMNKPDTLSKDDQQESEMPKSEAVTSMNDDDSPKSNPRLAENATPVPSSRISRAFNFASLGIRLAGGAALEASKRVISPSTNSSSVMTSDANADMIAESLCRMRGAALKLGQMLSIQDETLLSPALSRALSQVRQGANAMPSHQLQSQLKAQIGADWRSLLDSFQEVPIAAASIGQVHRATLLDGREVAIKVQYPGVADSIESDLRNLQMICKMSGMFPPGLFIEEVIKVGRKEVSVECDYIQERQNQLRFQDLVKSDDMLSRQMKFEVPNVIDELSSEQVLTTQFARGGTIDKVSDLPQEERNRIARGILRLTILELFQWRFMQTDPNWGNFLYDMGTGTTHLIDFGACREFDKGFVDGYLKIVWSAANRDQDTLMSVSHDMGFLTGEENDIMKEAHKMSGFTVGEPFMASDEPYDFRKSDISRRLSEHSSDFMRHRLTPPPEEVYTLHRKLAGAYMLCIKLGAVIHCRDLLEEIMANHVFDDDSQNVTLSSEEECTDKAAVA